MYLAEHWLANYLAARHRNLMALQILLFALLDVDVAHKMP